MGYLIQDIIHGIVYKYSGGYKYEMVCNLTEIDLSPFDLFCYQVVKQKLDNVDTIISIVGNNIQIEIKDINKIITI